MRAWPARAAATQSRVAPSPRRFCSCSSSSSLSGHRADTGFAPAAPERGACARGDAVSDSVGSQTVRKHSKRSTWRLARVAGFRCRMPKAGFASAVAAHGGYADRLPRCCVKRPEPANAFCLGCCVVGQSRQRDRGGSRAVPAADPLLSHSRRPIRAEASSVHAGRPIISDRVRPLVACVRHVESCFRRDLTACRRTPDETRDGLVLPDAWSTRPMRFCRTGFHGSSDD